MILVLTDRAARVAGFSRGVEAAGGEARVRDDVDLSSMKMVRAAVAEAKPRAAVLWAGWDDLDGCEGDEARAFADNAETAISLAAATLEFGAVPVLVSTAEVFGGAGGPWSEADPPQPASTYARSRLKGEQFLSRAAKGGLVLRTGPVLEDGLATWQDGLQAEVEVADDEMVTPVGAADVGRATVALLDAEVQGVVHVAGPDAPASRAEVWQAVAEALGRDPGAVRPVHGRTITGRAERARHPALFADRLKKVLDAPLSSWRASLAAAVAAAPRLAPAAAAPQTAGDAVAIDRPEGADFEGGARVEVAAGAALLTLSPGGVAPLTLPAVVLVLSGKALLEVGAGTEGEADHVLRPGRRARIPAGAVVRFVAVEASEVLVLGEASDGAR